MPQYNCNLSETNLLTPMVKLEVLYESIPGTIGCEKCSDINGDRKDWCCKEQSPSLFYSEFIYIWREVERHWSKRKKLDLIIRAIRNYLANITNKGCIFYDSGCQTYKQRPLACRLYGVMPKESWEEREKRIRNIFGEDVKISPQCSLVSVNREIPISLEEENKWFLKTREAEQSLGVDSHTIMLHDNPGGSYRTFHDHLLMELFSLNFLSMLTQIKMTNPSKEDVESTLQYLMKNLEEQGVVK